MTSRLFLVVAALLSAFPAQAAEQVRLKVDGRLPNPVLNRTPAPYNPPRLLKLDPRSLKLSPTLNPGDKVTLAPLIILPGVEVLPLQETRIPRAVVDPALKDLQDLAGPRDEQTSAADGADFQKGRQLFDNARGSDAVPFEPKPGDTVRVDGLDYVLGEKIFSTWHHVYRVEHRPDLILKFLRADPRAGYQNALEADDEVGGHARLEGTGLAHTRLLAHSRDKRVLVKEYFPGETAAEIAQRGPLSARQKEALADVAAELLRSGHSADLNRGNLVWDDAGGRWVLIDAGFFRKAGPAAALAQLFFDPQPGNLPGVDAVWLLSAIRDRLGADSPAWKAALSGWSTPEMKARFAALTQADEENADAIPADPKEGDTVRVAGKTYVLGKFLGSGYSGSLFRVEGQPGIVIKFPSRSDSENPLEVAALQKLAQTDIAHTKLLGSSKDGSVLIKEFVAGETALTIAERGRMTPRQMAALAKVAADMIRAGLSADFKPENYVWNAGRWVLIDAGMLADDPPWKILELMMERQLADHRHVDQVQWLRAVRERLGARSSLWKDVLAGASQSYYLYEPLEAIPAADEIDAALDLPVEGNIVRVSGVDYVLGGMFNDGLNAFVFRVRGRPDLVIKIQRRNGKGYTELEGLELLSETKTAHTRAVARSADGRVVVKEYAEGETAKEISRRGPYSRAQLEAFASLAAEMIRSGVSGDLNRGNFVWDEPNGLWILIDAGGLDAAKPWQAFARLFTPGQFATQSGLDQDEFLPALKKSLGAGSEAWKQIEESRQESPHVDGLLKKLAAAEKAGPRSLK